MAAYSDIIRSTIASMSDVASLVDTGAVIWGGTSGGSANAQTITTSPTVTTHSTGLRIGFIAGFTTTSTTPTINVNSIGAVTTKRSDASVSIIGDLFAGQYHEIIYNGSNWLVMNPASVWTDYSPTYTGFSVNPSNTVARYIVGPSRTCRTFISIATAGTSNTTGFTITAPITAATKTNAVWGAVPFQIVDNGSAITTPGGVTIGSGGTLFTVEKNISLAGGSWTAANGKGCHFLIEYEV